MEEQKGIYSISQVFFAKNGIIIYFHDFFWPVTKSKFRAALDFTISILWECNIEPDLSETDQEQ